MSMTLASHDMNVPDFIRVMISEYQAEYTATQFKLHMASDNSERLKITGRLNQIADHLSSMRSWLEECDAAVKSNKETNN